jgi:hypothetical protein
VPTRQNRHTIARLYEVAIVREDLSEVPLRALRTRRQIDQLLSHGYTIRKHLIEHAWGPS